MSELKVYHHELRHNEYEEFYLKYEADKVIALLTDKSNYNEYAYKLKSEELADTCRFYEDEIRRQKYKRCLNKAEWCEERCARYDLLQEHSGFSWRREIDFYFRWYQRWLELAEKFKEEK